MKLRSWIVFASLAICASACADGPGNLLPNGDFASSLDGWTCKGACSWIAQGALSDGTGAIASPPFGASIIVSSCFPIQPQTVYDVSFDAWANFGLTGADFLLLCRAYASTDCAQATGNFSYLPFYYVGSGWQGIQGQHATAAGEYSAQCEVNLSEHRSEMRMDNFIFAFSHQLDGIYADGFDGSP
ncbi:hypothetical protein DFR29_114161 [Tahibacter aquaticus]|uniref:Uncharacterized protein n=1 Tax=Tahibacter aquaticus TaxID=520092 RepID=A0A4R6YQD5_9GAMM|nr:hypothetical protein [Tahibacter aquaticus]TDR40109.1 hypothetical protein DFR29_114161 [Tahibacter aquaticus]